MSEGNKRGKKVKGIKKKKKMILSPRRRGTEGGQTSETVLISWTQRWVQRLKRMVRGAGL